MNILAINLGSSSGKITLYEFPSTKILAYFEFKNYGDKFTLQIDSDTTEISQDSYQNIVSIIYSELEKKSLQVNKIVHRVVHGGRFDDLILQILKENIEELKANVDRAPLHNVVAIEAIQKTLALWDEIPQYMVFDTSFHSTLELKNILYGLPFGYYENLGIRRFGFHGISYLSQILEIEQSPEFAKLANKKIISCHLGSGSSVCAINNKQSVNHSFGFSPTENLIMATRVGEIDYDAVVYLKKKLGLTEKDLETILNKESGLLGISGYTKDMEELVADYNTVDRAKLAVDMYVDKVVEYIAKFYVEQSGVDLLVFSGGIGFRSSFIRAEVVKKLTVLGFEIDNQKNNSVNSSKGIVDISSKNSICKILVVESSENKFMANLCYNGS